MRLDLFLAPSGMKISLKRAPLHFDVSKGRRFQAETSVLVTCLRGEGESPGDALRELAKKIDICMSEGVAHVNKP